MPPFRIRHWLVQEQIGQGATATVYKAFNEQTSATNALKVFQDSVSQRAVLREAAVMQQLKGPGFVDVYETFSWEKQSVIAMELVDGVPLSKMSNLNLAESVNLILQAAKILNAAHRVGILHRDVKPSNLMHTSDGDIVVLDFGLAKIKNPLLRQQDNLEGTISEKGYLLGTPAYMAPEQAAAPHAVGQAGDIYGLGCAWFFLVDGKAMFSPTTIADAIVKHNDPDRPSLFAAIDSSHDLANRIFYKMVSRSLADRYKFSAHLVDDLEQLHEQCWSSMTDIDIAKDFLESLKVQ